MRGQAAWCVLAGLLVAGTAGAAPVEVIATAQNAAPGTRMLRVPRTGSFTGTGSARSYVGVGVAISDSNHRVQRVIWFEERLEVSGALTRQVERISESGGVTCRSEIWGMQLPVARSGYFEITVEPITGVPPSPSLAASVIAFRNVGSTTVGGPGESANDGANSTTINKTVHLAREGDALMNSVCTSWSGAAPGMPGPDPARNPEMVPYTFQVTTALQNFTGVSPGPPPTQTFRHLRWLQSGTRVWALVALTLVAGTPPDAGAPDLAPPIDMGTPTDIGAPNDMAPVDTGPPNEAGPIETAPPPDATPADTTLPDRTSPEPDGAGPTAPDAIEAALPELPSLSDGGATQIEPRDWRVGCACEVGAPSHAPGPAFALLVGAIVRLARRRR